MDFSPRDFEMNPIRLSLTNYYYICVMETRQQILKKINWDYTHSVEDQEKILSGMDLRAKLPIYHKLLKSVRWYTLQTILSENELREILAPEVIDHLHPPSLRANFQHARHILFG